MPAVRYMHALLLAAVLVLPAVPAPARRHDPEKIPITHVRDLHYGDALFYFYQDDDFTALTRLLAYEHWQRMPHHVDEAQLLEGGLHLAPGIPNEAGERSARPFWASRSGDIRPLTLGTASSALSRWPRAYHTWAR